MSLCISQIKGSTSPPQTYPRNIWCLCHRWGCGIWFLHICMRWRIWTLTSISCCASWWLKRVDQSWQRPTCGLKWQVLRNFKRKDCCFVTIGIKSERLQRLFTCILELYADLALEYILGKKAFLMTWNGSLVAHLNGFLVLGGGNLNINICSKILMP